MTISHARLLRMCATSRPREVSMFCSHVAFALAEAHGTSPRWRKTSRLKEWIALGDPGRDHERVTLKPSDVPRRILVRRGRMVAPFELVAEAPRPIQLLATQILRQLLPSAGAPANRALSPAETS